MEKSDVYAILHEVKQEVRPWHGFKTGLWQEEINVRDFIQQNYTPYESYREPLEHCAFLQLSLRSFINKLGSFRRFDNPR